MQNRTHIIALLLFSTIIFLLSATLKVSCKHVVVVENPYDFLLEIEVDGVRRLIPPHFKARISYGKYITVISNIVYVSYDTRYIFYGWYVNDSLRIPVFKEEVLINVYASLNAGKKKILLYTRWVPSGVPVTIHAPSRIEESKDIIHVFRRWKIGFNPLSTNNTIVVTKPTIVEAVYDTYLKVTIYIKPFNRKTTLWVKYGSNLIKIFNTTEKANGRTYRFKNLYAIGEYSKYSTPPNILFIKVYSPVKVIVEYVPEFKVYIKLPSGIIRKIVGLYDEITIPEIEREVTFDNVRYVFRYWLIQSETGIEYVKSLNLRYIVTSDVNITAIYDVEYKVTISSPLGIQSSWVKANSEFYVYQPVKLPATFFTYRVLESYVVDGRVLKAPSTGVVRIVVDKPTTIIAVYKYVIDWLHIGLLVASIFLIVLGYLLYVHFFGKGKK